jgi:glutaminase
LVLPSRHDGRVYSTGDHKHAISIQSIISKLFTLTIAWRNWAMALDSCGSVDSVPFNSITMLEYESGEPRFMQVRLRLVDAIMMGHEAKGGRRNSTVYSSYYRRATQSFCDEKSPRLRWRIKE